MRPRSATLILLETAAGADGADIGMAAEPELLTTPLGALTEGPLDTPAPALLLAGAPPSAPRETAAPELLEPGLARCAHAGAAPRANPTRTIPMRVWVDFIDASAVA
jgi:hypothetical protein